MYPDISDPKFLEKIGTKKEFAKDDWQFAHQRRISIFLSANVGYKSLLLFHDPGTGKTGTATKAATQCLQDGTINKVVVLAKGGPLLSSFRIEAERREAPIRKFKFYTIESFGKILRSKSEEHIKNLFGSAMFIIDEAHHLSSFKATTVDAIANAATTAAHRLLLLTATPARDKQSQFDALAKFFPDGLTGRVSRVKIDPEGTPKRLYAPENTTRVSYWKNKMSDFQSRVHDLHYTKCCPTGAAGAAGGKDGAFYSPARQAALFVFPDGSVGTAGSNKYLIETKYLIRKGEKFIKPTAELKNAFANLQMYSAPYASLVQHLRDQPKGKAFVYCEYVNGGGLKLLAEILKYNGYFECKGSETTPRLRYAIITSESSRGIKRIIDLFNDPVNSDGSWCRVLLGSRVASEGFSLYDISAEYIMSPHWNFSETKQAIARGIRAGSHKTLVNTPVRVYLSTSVSNMEKSVDRYIYDIAMTKESALAQLSQTLEDNSIERFALANPTDFGDFNTFWRQPEYIWNTAKDNINVTLDQLSRMTKYDRQGVVQSLLETKCYPYVDKDGYNQYIMIHQDKIISTRLFNVRPEWTNTENMWPTVIPLFPESHRYLLREAQDLIQYYSTGAFYSADMYLSLTMLQYALIAMMQNVHRTDICDKILKDCQDYYGDIDGILALWLHGKAMWLDTDQMQWIKGDDAFQQKARDHVMNRYKTCAVDNIYGTTNPITWEFCLSRLDPSITDARKIKVGKRCKNWSRDELIDILVRKLDTTAPPNAIYKATETIEHLPRQKWYRPGDEKYGLDLYYWFRQKGVHLCHELRQQLSRRGAHFYSLNCGQQNKARQL